MVIIFFILFLYNYYSFEMFYIFNCLKGIWLSMLFYEECFKILVRSFQHLIHSIGVKLIVFSTSDFGFLAFGMTSDFQLYHGHFSYYVRRDFILFKCSNLVDGHPVRFSVWICPTFVGSSSNGSLVFRALAMLFWSVSYLWYCWSWCLQRRKAPVDSWCCWAHLKVGGGGYRSHWACIFLCHWQRSGRCRTLLMLPFWMNWSVSQCPGCEVEARTARAFLLLLLADQSLGLLAATAAGW